MSIIVPATLYARLKADPRLFASNMQRFKATCYDFLVIVAIFFLVPLTLHWFFMFTLYNDPLYSPSLDMFWDWMTLHWAYIAPIFSILLFAWQESSMRQATFGMQRAGIIVCGRAGNRFTFKHSFKRNFLRYLILILFLFTYAESFFILVAEIGLFLSLMLLVLLIKLPLLFIFLPMTSPEEECFGKEDPEYPKPDELYLNASAAHLLVEIGQTESSPTEAI